MVKPLSFLGNSLDELRAFPISVRRNAGYQLDRVQHGHLPTDWKPTSTIGPGVQEVRLQDGSGAFRVIYIASLPDAVYVLHCFQKKTEQTAGRNLAVATNRYRQLRKELRQ